MIESLDWITKNAGQGKWQHIDGSKIAAAGQSCGGIQAFSASLDPRVKLTGIFNSGLINAENTDKFKQLHGPVGFFLGGPADIAYKNVSVAVQLKCHFLM
jgi:dienelactone hydrolase